MHRIKMEVLTMLKRKIEKDIMHWIEGSNQALLVYGVRQAGKTFIIRKCLKAAGCDFIEFNIRPGKAKPAGTMRRSVRTSMETAWSGSTT